MGTSWPGAVCVPFPEVDRRAVRFPAVDRQVVTFPGVDRQVVTFPPHDPVDTTAAVLVVDIGSAATVRPVVLVAAHTEVSIISTVGGYITGSTVVDITSAAEVAAVLAIDRGTVVDIGSALAVTPAVVSAGVSVLDVASAAAVRPVVFIASSTAVDIESRAQLGMTEAVTVVEIGSAATLAARAVLARESVVDVGSSMALDHSAGGAGVSAFDLDSIGAVTVVAARTAASTTVDVGSSGAIAPAFLPSGMTKSGTKTLTTSFAEIAGWVADTANYPGSTVSGSALVAQGGKLATLTASVRVTSVLSTGTISVQIKVNGVIAVTGSASPASSVTAVATGTYVVAPGDLVTVEVRTSSGTYVPTVASGVDTYLRIT